MTNELTQFTISEITPAYWQISFSNPPINLQDPDTIPRAPRIDRHV
jgi:hypothetical protein